jgi:hypothetical protein
MCYHILACVLCNFYQIEQKQLSMSALVHMLENSKLKDDNFTLRATNAFIKAENAAMKNEIAALKAREITEPSITNYSPNTPQRAEAALSNESIMPDEKPSEASLMLTAPQEPPASNKR